MTVEFLAEELHKFYRAAYKTFVQYRVHNDGVHDHGWKNCHRKAYFARRAQAILDGVSPKFQGAMLRPNWERPTEEVKPYDDFVGLTAMLTAQNHQEDVEAYDRTIQRWKSGNGVSRFIYYSAQRLTLEVVGLAAMRAARQANQAN